MKGFKMIWKVLSRDSDNSSPWQVVRNDGVIYPENIPGQSAEEYTTYSDANRVKNSLNAEEESNNEFRFEIVKEYDSLTLSLYKSMLKLKIRDIIKEQKVLGNFNTVDILRNINDTIDSFTQIDQFEEVTNVLLLY